MYFVYLLRCKDKSLYCGQTNDLQRRIEDHNSSRTKSAKYTKSRRPVHLVYIEKLKTKSEALKREYEIKNFTKNQKEFLVLSSKEMENLIPSKSKKKCSD